jgi:iron-sulfur cluster repair protein YtfE (RIC family)
MRLEEQEVFPFLADLLDRGRNKNIDSAEQIKERIAGLRSDHNHIGKLFDEIRQLNNRLIPPEIFDTFSACEVIAGSEGQNIPDEVCSFYRVISVNFEEVERVIRDSVHLENNLFIPNIGRYLQMN